MGYFPPTHTHQSWNRELNAKTQIRYYWHLYPKCVTAKHPGRNIPYAQFAHELRTNEWTNRHQACTYKSPRPHHLLVMLLHASLLPTLLAIC